VNRETIIKELYTIPTELKKAEARYLELVETLNTAKHNLFSKECELLMSNKVTGRNEAQRQAEMFPYTKELHKEVFKAEAKLDIAKVEYHYLKIKNENLQIIGKLLT
jgi:hypothetical protein